MSNMKKLYWYSFCNECVFAYPVYAVYFVREGLSLFQLSMLLGWWCISSLLLEMPSAALGDQYDRRLQLAVSPIFKAICFLVWFAAGGSFMLYALGFLVWSAAGALQSGTFEALLFDTLKSDNRTDDYERELGRIRLFSLAGIALASICGGIIARYWMGACFLLPVLPLAAASLIGMSLREPARYGEQRDTRYIDHFVTAWRELRSNRTLRYTFIYQVVGISLIYEVEEYNPLYCGDVGYTAFFLGVYLALQNAAESIGSLIGYRLKSTRRLECLVPLGCGIVLVLSGVLMSKAMVFLIVGMYLLASAIQVVIGARGQRAIVAGGSRATISSCCGMAGALVAIPFTLLFGWISKFYGLGPGYVMAGLVLLAFSMWVARTQKKDTGTGLDRTKSGSV